MREPSKLRSGGAIVMAVAVRPQLWFVAIVQLFRLAPTKWWARAPFLPIPTRDYLSFRTQTQYGGYVQNHAQKIESKDVVSYLNWLRDFR